MQMPSWMQSRVQYPCPLLSAWATTGPESHLNYNILVTAVVTIPVNRDLHFDTKLSILTNIIRLQDTLYCTNLCFLNRKIVLESPQLQKCQASLDILLLT